MTNQSRLLERTETAAPERAAALAGRFRAVRSASEALCEPLEPEDFCIQSMPDVSPTKWHLAHTSWFFETFVLKRALPGYHTPHEEYEVLFNSYYNAVGEQHARAERGVLSRPTVREVFAYRAWVDESMEGLFAALEAGETFDGDLLDVIETGLHHEQQHQELMLMDVKHVFSRNPLRPAYRELPPSPQCDVPPLDWTAVAGAVQRIGHNGGGFAFDNETPQHRVYVEPFQIANRLVTCGEYLEFIEDGGYRRPELWLSDGWNVVRTRGWDAPLYWEPDGQRRRIMTLGGMRDLNPAEPVCHVSYYEADAYARWAGCWLPREAAWETVARERPVGGNFVEEGLFHPRPLAADVTGGQPAQMFGDVWEWTCSPYNSYPGYRPRAGALGEYNGKFMCNQMVLRGGSCATPATHIRATYRNFFPPDARWPFTGIRLTRERN